MKVGIYCRVSTDKQENENQLLQLREFVTKQGWVIHAEYTDVVTGSGKKLRPQFDKMMLAASQRQFDILLFWKLDRLSREGVAKTVVILERLEGWGVHWRSFTEPFLDSCGIMREVVISIMATLAKQERLVLSERTRAGLQRARKNGVVLGAKRIEIDMARVHARQAAGESLRSIARELGISPGTLVNRRRARELL